MKRILFFTLIICLIINNFPLSDKLSTFGKAFAYQESRETGKLLVKGLGLTSYTVRHLDGKYATSAKTGQEVELFLTLTLSVAPLSSPAHRRSNHQIF